VIGTDELRRTLREYVLLDVERALVADGARRDHLRGAARAAWLARVRAQLEVLRWRLIALAIVDEAAREERR
jgi:hypothetical protein